MANSRNQNSANSPGKVSAPNVDPAQTLTGSDKTETADQLPRNDGPEAGVDYAVPGNDPSTVEKITVKTTGQFGLQDPFTGKYIKPGDEGTEAVKTSFIQNELDSGRLVEA